MGVYLHAEGTNDPKDVRNLRTHVVALIASMSALASESLSGPANYHKSIQRAWHFANGGGMLAPTAQWAMTRP